MKIMIRFADIAGYDDDDDGDDDDDDKYDDSDDYCSICLSNTSTSSTKY